MYSLDNRHSLALPYWARPGIMSFAKPAAGGGGDKDEDDDEEDDDEDEDGDDDEDEDEDDDDLAELTEDELKTELRKTREQLNRSTSSNAAKRKRLKAREAELLEARKGKPAAASKGKGKGKSDDDDDAPDLDAIKAVAKAEAKTEADGKIKRAEARGALKGAGIPSAQVGQLVGMLKLDDIDIDDDGEVDEDSLDEAIDALKKTWPQLFPKGTARKRERVAGDKDGDGKTTRSRRPMTTTEMQVAAALGKPIRR